MRRRREDSNFVCSSPAAESDDGCVAKRLCCRHRYSDSGSDSVHHPGKENPVNKGLVQEPGNAVAGLTKNGRRNSSDSFVRARKRTRLEIESDQEDADVRRASPGPTQNAPKHAHELLNTCRSSSSSEETKELSVPTAFSSFNFWRNVPRLELVAENVTKRTARSDSLSKNHEMDMS